MSTWKMRFAAGVLATAWWQATWPTTAIQATGEDALQQTVNGGTVTPRRILDPDWPMIQDVSADGRFSVGRQRAGNSTLRVVLRDISTGATRVLFTGGGASTISDDGRMVAFTTMNGDSLGLVSTDPGAAPRFFPSPEGTTVRTEDWAASGDRVLVLLSRRGQNGQPAMTELAWFSLADLMFRTIRTFPSSEQPVVPRVAPNGRYVTVAVTDPGNTNGRLIFVIDSDGRAAERVAATEGEFANPSWTSDSRSLMFVRARDGKSELWSVGIEGGRRATEPRLLYGDLAGRLLGMTSAGALIFRRGDSPNIDEYAGNVAHIFARPSSPARRPVTFGGCCVSWSPDGTSIGLISQSARLVTREIVSGNERTFDLPAAAVSRPLWVADGSAVIVTTQRVGESGVIYRVNVQSGDSQRLFALRPTQSRPFAVSRDGKTVYLGRRLESGRFGSIVAVDAVSDQERQIVSLPADAQNTVAPAVSLSPNGRTFAVMVQPSGKQTEGRIFTVDVDGSGYRNIGAVPASGWTDLRWTPDGRSLLFPAFDAQRNWRIMRVELSGGKVTPDGLTYDLLVPLVPEIRVNPGNFSGLDVSPDGTRMVVSTLTLARSEIWTLDGLRWER